MVDETQPPSQPSQRPSDRYEARREEAAEVFFAESKRFLAWDGDMNDLMKDLLTTVVQEVKKNPNSLFTSQGDSIADLVSALKAKPGGCGGVSGGDIVGAGVFTDLIDFIKALGDRVDSEKSFFLKIIFLFFCRDRACDCLCKCMCD